MKTGLNFLGLLVATLAFPACSNKSGAPEEVRENQVPRGQLKLAGSPLERLERVARSPFAGSCETRQLAANQELFLAIERSSHSFKNELPRKKGEPENQSQLIPFQGSYLLNEPKTDPEEIGWQRSKPIRWRDLHEFYLEHKDSLDSSKWRYLNSKAQRLLLEDEDRVLNGSNYGIDHTQVTILNDLHSAVASCSRTPGCIKIGARDGTLSLARTVPMYVYFLDKIEKSRFAEESRYHVVEFEKRLKRDLQDFGFRPEPSLTLTRQEDKLRINVPMDPGQLDESEQQLARSAIETVWVNEKAKVSIEWRPRTHSPYLFSMLFHPDQVGRPAHVNHNDRTMNLVPFTRVRTIAHELGHILGFRDHYYWIWDESVCGYVYESNDSDLMSNSSSGDVTPEEWQTLLELEEKPAS